MKNNINETRKKEIIGIYKITSPSGKVYIGQSINIFNRWEKYYYNLKCEKQPKLYNSLKKYGPENHVFEVIEKYNLEQLNEQETFYKQQFIDEFGWKMALFCELYDLGIGGPMSEETKQKIGNANRGKKNPHNEEWKRKVSIANKGMFRSKETRKKIGEANKGNKGPKGYKYTEEQKMKMRKPKHTDSFKIKQSLRILGSKQPLSTLIKKFKPIIQKDLTGKMIKEWESLKEASLSLNIKSGDISNVCSGKQKTAGGFIWKYKKI